MTKEEVNQIIEKLEEGKCRCFKYCVECFCGAPHRPIFIGDVLERTEDNFIAEKGVLGLYHQKLVALWLRCGANKSLQQIVEESGWESAYELARSSSIPIVTSQEMVDQMKKTSFLKSPAKALFEFLHQLFFNEEV